MGAEADPCRSGLVVALQANYCSVELDAEGPEGEQRLLCTRRTRLSKTGQTICVGDRVHLDGVDWNSGRAAVAAVELREGLMLRPAVANVSRVVVVASLAEPVLDPLQLSRFLVAAEATGQQVHLAFSKADLLENSQVEAWCTRVRRWGYDPLVVSTRRSWGLDALHRCLSQPGITVLCGPSGVGKSSLINTLRPELNLRVSPVSGRLQRGRHTTRHVELFAIAPGALVADTPGFNRPELPPRPEQLACLFPEVRQKLALHSCRFSNCLHQGEPGCAVGSHWERQPWYLNCLEAISQHCERQDQQRSRTDGPAFRRRGGRLEPRLDHQLRQRSRRGERQQAWREGRQQAEEISLPGQADSDRDLR